MSDETPDGSGASDLDKMSDAMFRWRIGLGRFPGTKDEWRVAMRGIYGPVWDEVERVREENAEARQRHRERALERLYGLCGSTYERPCAACGEFSPWFVCLLCSTGMPIKGTWRIKPEAAERVRAKLRAMRDAPALPLPTGVLP